MRELLYENPDPNGQPTLLPGREQAQTKLFSLLQDSYGNYVVQTCLSEGSHKAPREYAEMSNLLRPVVHQLSRNVPYMKRIQSLLSLPTSPAGSDDEITDFDGRHDGGSSSAAHSSPLKGKSKSKPTSRRESNADRRRHTIDAGNMNPMNRAGLDDISPSGVSASTPNDTPTRRGPVPPGSAGMHTKMTSGGSGQRR